MLAGWIIAGVVSLSLAALAITLRVYGPVFVLGPFGLFIIPACLDSVVARTELSAAGLETSSLFRKHSCRWDEVEGIDTLVSSSQGNRSTQIVVRLKARKPIKLCAPFDSNMGRDPDFHDKLEQIRAYWTQRA